VESKKLESGKKQNMNKEPREKTEKVFIVCC